MGEPGIQLIERELFGLQREYSVDLTIAQSENVSDGKGMTPEDMRRLQAAGVQFFTGGNHSVVKKALYPLLAEESEPVLAPANMTDIPGRGWKYIDTAKGEVLVISLLGETVGRGSEKTNPLQAIDAILHQNVDAERIATVVNFHGDYSSEKVIIGYYLDGRVSMVVGDHWHVPTADAEILPKGTAHITDVGMCGVLDSSLGISFDSVIPRWRDGVQTKNNIEEGGRRQLNALFVAVNEKTGKAEQCEHIRRIYSE